MENLNDHFPEEYKYFYSLSLTFWEGFHELIYIGRSDKHEE